MKKILITLLVLLCTLGASALEFDEDRFHYATITGSTDSETGLIHVRLTGVASGMLFSYDDRVRIPGHVTHNGTTYLVEEIATGAFANIPNLHYVQIGYGVRRIATYAFLDTNFAIRGIYLPSSVKTVEGQAFYVASNCAITLMHLKNLPTFASNWMLGLQSGQFNVYVPTQAQVDDVKNAQFFQTYKPKSITVTPSVACDISQVLDGFRYYSVFVQEPTALQEGKLAVVGYSNESSTFNGFLIAAASSNYATVGSGVKRSYYTEIADSAFMGSFSTYSGKVQISGSHLERIGEGAFANCAMLEAVSIYDVPVIAMRAFYNCTNLKTLNLDTGIESIEFEAFYGGAYEKVTIPGTVTFIDYTAFTYSSLKNYGVMSSNNTFSTYKGMLFNKAQTTLLSIPTMTPNTIIDASCLPTTLKSIGTYAGRSNKTVTDVNLPYGVTTIRNAAFGFMESVKSVRLPSSITSCGYHVFCYTKDFDLCFAWLDNIPRTIEEELLEYSTPTIYIPNAKAQDLYSASPAFEGQTFNVDPMKAYDFMDVATPSDGGVVAVTSCVTKAATSSADGEAAIVGGTGKLRINMGDGVPAYYPNYDGKYYIYKSVYENAFNGNNELTEVSINSSYLTSIGASAFRSAPNITTININAPATIGAYAFMETPATSITLNSVTMLGKQAFYHASACPKLTIPASVTSIGDRALVAMNGTQTFTVNSSNPNYSSDSHGFIYNKDKSKLVVVPGATTYTVLNDVSFPNAMKEIDSYAFYWNLAVKDVRVPYGVTKIGDEAFVGAENLENLHIPSSADLGNSFRLYGCMSLKYLTINQEVPPTLGSNGLVYVNSNCYVYVPLRPQSSISDHDEARVGLYKDNAQWSRLKVRYGAYDFIDNSIAYTVQSDGTLAVVQGQLKGDILRQVDANGNQLKSITVPEKVTYRGNTYTVTVLDNAAFKDNTAVESITLPNTITNFEGERDHDFYVGVVLSGMQFSGCTSLKSIKLPSNITAIPEKCFEDTKIEKLTLPYGIKTIATRAFKNAKIGELLIPSSCQRFWYSHLIDMKSLDRLILNVLYYKYDPTILDQPYYDDVKSLLSDTWVYVPCRSYDDYNSLDLFAKAKSVRFGAYDFKVNGGAGGYLTVMDTGDAKFVHGPEYNDAITSVTMGLVEDDIYTDKHYNATSLEAWAFYDAQNLSQFDLNGTELTDIPEYAFGNCTSLKTLPFNSPYFRPQSIGKKAFLHSGLEGSVVLPETVTDIGNDAFNYCFSLDELVLPYLPIYLGEKTIYKDMKDGFRCYADRKNLYGMKINHTNVYPYVRENTPWTTVTLRNVGSEYYQVEDLMAQGGELYVVDAVSDKWVVSMKKVQPGQRVDKSGQCGYLARIEPGRLYRLSATNRNDITFPQTTNLIVPKYTIGSDGRPVREKLDASLYEIDPNATAASSSDDPYPAPRFVRVYYNGTSSIGYGYLSTKGGGPDVITAQQSVRGDVNGDGTVGIGDIVAITNIMAGIETNPDYIARADVNGDQGIGIGDIVTITNIMAGIE
jgi:hypothetical protein